MNKWKALGTAFENLGIELAQECENTGELAKDFAEADQLYSNYAQLLESIKAQRRMIHAIFNEMDQEGFC